MEKSTEELPLRRVLKGTVRINPYRGQRVIYTSLPPQHVGFGIEGAPDLTVEDFPKEFRAVLENSVVGHGSGSYTFLLCGDHILNYGLEYLHNRVLQIPKVWKASMHPIKFDQQAHTVPPDNRPFLFSYENIEVNCFDCGEKVRVDDLESDSIEDPENFCYSDKVCPKCHAWNCADWEDEVLSDNELAELAQKNLGCEGAEGN